MNVTFQAASHEIYNASQAEDGAQGPQGYPNADQPEGQPTNDGEVTDVDFEEVK